MAAKILNDDYRNGLIHEGRIKNMGQFCYDIDELISIGQGNSMVNPFNLRKGSKNCFL